MAGAAPDGELAQLLAALLEKDGDRRRSAEEILAQRRTEVGFGERLARFVANATASELIPLRQLSLTVLKRIALECWADVPNQDKAVVQAVLVRTLGDSNSKVRPLAQAAVSAVAAKAPQWPELYTQLAAAIESQDMHEAKCGVECISVLLSEAGLEVAGALAPLQVPLLRLAESPTTPPEVRRLCVTAHCDGLVAFVQCEAPAAALETVVSSYPAWGAVHAALCAGVEGWSDKDRIACAFTAVRVSTTLSRLSSDIHSGSAAWPRSQGVIPVALQITALEGLLRPVWLLLQTVQPVYIQSVVQKDDDGASEEEEGAAQLVAQVMELLQAMLKRQKLRALLKKYTQQVLQLLVPFMQITEAQVRQWREDPNEFLAHEDDEHVQGCVVRLSGEGLVAEYMAHMRKESTKALVAVTAQLLERGEQGRTAGEPYAWKLTELALFLFSLAAGTGPVKALQRGDMASLSPTALRAAAAISADAGAVDFLRARAFAVLHRMGDAVCANSASDIPNILKTAAVGMQREVPLVVRVSACRAFCRYLTATEDENLRGQLLIEQRVLVSFGALIQDADNEVLHLALESLALIVRLCGSAMAEASPYMAPLICECWQRNKSDALAHLSVEDLVSNASASHPRMRQALEEALVPLLAQDLQPGVELYLTAASIDLYGVLLKRAEVPLTQGMLECARLVLAAVLRSDESRLLQNACDALCCLVRRSPQQVSDSGLLELSFRAVERLLSLDLDDNGSLFVGPLVTLLMQKFGSQLPADLARGLLNVLVVRLTRAELPFLIQSLSAVIARLLVEDFNGVINTLAAMEVAPPSSASVGTQGSRSGLEALLTLWMEKYEHMRSKHSRNVFYTALCRIHVACSQDPRLGSMQVGGQPLAEKIVEALVKALEYETERNKRQTQGGMGDLDSDEDEDDDEDDDEDIDDGIKGDEDNALFSFAKGGMLLSELVGLDDDDDDEDIGDLEGGDTFQAVEREDPLYSLDLQRALVEHLGTPGLLATSASAQKASAAVAEAMAQRQQ